ncbi:uncharacterized protein VICG_02101 [Vittaforma corneae ATCC 50505]|uniref:U2A'/phosphoprotein 32 family A C-terminal domain-containing protein n=1 Tax=Vittaforma corneae (strain ATCC 50505) TaxID=993615 RepID=L2GK14_VITCO|nr:uncharacterized protein VICG_02101 [Vittaforma corneae ATCC 50505]ELA40860.1 hypothetical protein VICG_02101 [Vittaforma corneae ATCC 50505]
MSKSKLPTLEVSGFDFDHIPIEAWKFLIDHCGVKELSISKTTIDIAAPNHSDLCNIVALYLVDVGLTEMPCLSNLTSLEWLCLKDNQIGYVNLQSYFDAETGNGTMPKLKYLDLSRNPVSKIDARIKEVFTSKPLIILSEEVMVDLSLPLSDVKHELKDADIELVEPDLVSQMDWMPVTD